MDNISLTKFTRYWAIPIGKIIELIIFFKNAIKLTLENFRSICKSVICIILEKKNDLIITYIENVYWNAKNVSISNNV